MTQQKTPSEVLIQVLRDRSDDLEGCVALAEAQSDKALEERDRFLSMAETAIGLCGYLRERMNGLASALAKAEAGQVATEEDRNALSNHCAVLEEQLEKAVREVGSKVSFDVETLGASQRESVLKLLSVGWVVMSIVALKREGEESTVDRDGYTTTHLEGTL